MRDEQTIQISLQLPVSELAGLTALAEHLRALLQTEKQPDISRTAEEKNSNFDMTRFRELDNDTRSSASEVSSAADVTAAHSQADSFLPIPEIAEFHVGDGVSPSLPDPFMQDLFKITEDLYPEGNQQMSSPGISREHEEASSASDGSDRDPAVKAATVESPISGDLSVPRSHRQQLPDAPAVPSSITVTAETVSQAFRRDDRRYDNGFPLY